MFPKLRGKVADLRERMAELTEQPPLVRCAAAEQRGRLAKPWAALASLRIRLAGFLVPAGGGRGQVVAVSALFSAVRPAAPESARRVDGMDNMDLMDVRQVQ